MDHLDSLVRHTDHIQWEAGARVLQRRDKLPTEVNPSVSTHGAIWRSGRHGMNRRNLAGFLALCVFGLMAEGGTSVVTVRSGFIKGQEFLQSSESRQRAYVMGLMDGFSFAPLLCLGDTLPRIEACVEDMSDVEITAILNRFLRDHPERLHESSNQLMYTALLEVCLKSAPRGDRPPGAVGPE